MCPTCAFPDVLDAAADARAALLTAWAGGPKASRLTGAVPQKLIWPRNGRASRRCSAEWRRALPPARAQDWQADAYARGGYSYVRVGGAGAREALAAPLEETLFFAGEATDPDEAGNRGGRVAQAA